MLWKIPIAVSKLRTNPQSVSNMGAPRVTPQEIVKMQQLYAKLGTYAAVAREIGRSADTVSRYVQMKGIPQNLKLAVWNLSQK